MDNYKLFNLLTQRLGRKPTKQEVNSEISRQIDILIATPKEQSKLISELESTLDERKLINKNLSKIKFWNNQEKLTEYLSIWVSRTSDNLRIKSIEYYNTKQWED